MLTYKEQKRLFDKYDKKNEKKGKTLIRDSLDQNFAINDKYSFIADTIAFSCIAFLDISNFSITIQDFETEEIKQYLDDYYRQILPIINKYSGKIDKIMGDGIIVIFSEIFGDEKDSDPIANAFNCCIESIQQFMNSDKPIKASISSGEVTFCRTGIEHIYEELTCLGHPITVAYRLESIAEENQVLILDDDEIADRIYEELNGKPVAWNEERINCNLQGLPENQGVQIFQL